MLQVNFLQSYYQGYNSTLVVTYSPGPTSNQLSLGGSRACSVVPVL